MAVLNKNLARWYREVSQHLRAGLPLPRALEKAGGVPVRDRRRMAEQLLAGDPIDVVLERARPWLPEVDRCILSSAAQSGQMVETLRVLAETRSFAASQTAQAIAATIYPLFLIHFAVLIVPLYLLISESVEAYLAFVVPIILPVWVLIVFLIWSVVRRHRWVRAVMRLIPLLRGYTRNRSLADLCFTLRAYISAGETIDIAWFGAARTSADRRLRRLGEMISNQARLGIPPGEQIGVGAILPEDFVSLYQTGEQSGQLDENLHHLWMLYSDRAAGNLRSASFWYPKFLIIAVAIGIGYIVVRAYAAHFETYMELL